MNAHTATVLRVTLACFLGAALPGCPTEPASAPPAWEVIADSQSMKAALFGTWGSAANDVWAVGATTKEKPEFGPQVLHWDGTSWTRWKSGATGELWWVAPGAAKGVLWMAGSEGQIVRRNADGSFTVMHTPDKTQLFGIHAVTDSDVYAVGGPGSCSGTGPCGVIWHFDGSTWSAAPGVSAAQLTEATWFKVWGSGAELWAVGSGGHMIHRVDGAWKEEPTGVTDTLFTVSGNASLQIAVGGFLDGVLLENSGSGWKTATIEGKLPGLNGVSVPAGGTAVAVGMNGAIWRRSGAGLWTQDKTFDDFLDNLHAVWKGESGDIFAVGGQISTPPFGAGALVHYGAATANKAILP